jgi:hypothetical protein
MIELRLGGAGEPGAWWPAKPGETWAFHWCCPGCGHDDSALLSRHVEPDGTLATPIRCGGCGRDDRMKLIGWRAEHEAQPGTPELPIRYDMRHLTCGTPIRLSDKQALYFARDPRIYRGHWCPSCRRHGPNHEWIWADGGVVGEGWYGVQRYSEIGAEQRQLLETHHPIPPEIRGSPR